MKTVLQILPSLRKINGGVERGTLDIAKELAEKNFNWNNSFGYFGRIHCSFGGCFGALFWSRFDEIKNLELTPDCP